MNADQQLTLRRLTEALDKRYLQVNGALYDTIEVLETLLDTLKADDPSGHAVNVALVALVRAADEGATLQWDVADILHRQLIQARSAKQAYGQGWENALAELLGRATPEQAKLIRTLLLDSADEDDLPF